ncbi:MAG: L,D-transpeptidase family protein [Candidatus Zhuqueibacterota bacterium]
MKFAQRFASISNQFFVFLITLVWTILKGFYGLIASRRRAIIMLAGAATIIGIVLALVLMSAKPPHYAIEQSWLALSKTRQAEAPYYTKDMYLAASFKWDELIREWRYQNSLWFFKRDFSKLVSLAEETTRLANQASAKANELRSSLKNTAQIETTLLIEKIEEIKSKYGDLPMDRSLRNRLNAGELLVLESQSAFKRNDFKQAVAKLKTAESMIGQSDTELTSMVSAYLGSIKKWRGWVQETIKWSLDSTRVAIVVDKMAHVCQVYDSGKLKTEFPIELGRNWIGHKRQKGDNATPEGQYFIRKKVGNGQSKYYKALVINYPNERDRVEFEAAKNRGELAPNAQIGGLIEIHGEGAKGTNWTQGCIALRNEDMDKIYNMVPVNTPVTIVGSINGLKDIYSNQKNQNNK